MGRRELKAVLGAMTWVSSLHPALTSELRVTLQGFRAVASFPDGGEVAWEELTAEEQGRYGQLMQFRSTEEEVDPWVTLKDGSVLLPRHAVDEGTLLDLGYDVTTCRPARPAATALRHIADSIELRNEVQREAFDALVVRDGGFLMLAPGKGKTVLALRTAAYWGQPTLVFLDNGGLVEQWRQRILQFWGVEPAQIGMVQSHFSRWTWEGRPITLALYNSFYAQLQHGNIPRRFFEAFGTVIWDEAQTAKSPSHCATLSLFDARRIGLSATPGTDGTEDLLFLHTGKPSYVNLESDLLPDCHFVPVDLARPKEFNTRGLARYGQMASHCLGGPRRRADDAYLVAVRSKIEELLERGRKVLVVTPRSGFGREFYEGFPQTVVIDQETPFHERDDALNSSNLVFVTTQLGERALDRADLDALLMVYPVGKSAEDRARQAGGRVLRLFPGKPTPLIYAFFPNNKYGRELARANEKLFRKNGYRILTPALKEPRTSTAPMERGHYALPAQRTPNDPVRTPRGVGSRAAYRPPAARKSR